MKTDVDSTDKCKIITDESISTKVSNVSEASSSNIVHHSTETANVQLESSSSSSLTNPKKRIIDETLLPPDEAEKILSRRAYNRDCATRARKRNKQLVQQLEKQVKELQADKEELRRSLSKVEQQVSLLDSQNKALLVKQMMIKPGNSNFSGSMSSNFGMGSTTLQQQPAAFPQLPSSSSQQLFPSMMGSSSTGGLDLAQANAILSRYMNGPKNGFY
jgi:TolA-binding protein